jgi:hypothetical protein
MVDNYRVFYPATRQYIFFNAAHGTFSKTDHILGHKASLNKFKKIEITPCIISDHNGTKLDLNNTREYRKYSNTWRLNNTLLKDQRVTEEVREEIKEFHESSETENTTCQNLWNIAKFMLRVKFIAISAYIKKQRPLK